MVKSKRAGKMHSLKDARHPVLVKKNGERIVAQTELGQLQEKRERIAAQLEEVDGEIVALKKKRHAELMAEIEELGLNASPSALRASRNGRWRISGCAPIMARRRSSAW